MVSVIPSSKKIGIDAGSSLVKLIEISRSGGEMGLAKFSLMPFRVPPNMPEDAIRQVQAKAIDGAIRKCECKCRDVVVGVPGNSAFIRNIKLPPVPASKIDQIVRYEIQQTIPFPIEDIALDYQVLEPDESSEVEVIMVAMKGEMAEDFIRGVEKAKVNVGIMDSIPLALYNCYRYNGYSKKDECTAIIDLGASTSHILIELGGELRYCRNVSIGGNDITLAIAKEFNIPVEQAERLKVQHGLIFPESEEAKFTEDQVRLSRAIASVLDRMVGEIKLTIGYFRSLAGAGAISRGILAGGGAMLKSIRPFLTDRLGVQVEILNPFKKVAVPKNLINARKMAPLFATAVGLALRSSGDCCQLKISLVPPQIKAAKSRRGRIFYNIASVVMVVGIIGITLWRLLPEADERAKIIEALDAEIARYEQYDSERAALTKERDTLYSELTIFARVPNMAADGITPLALLSDSMGEKMWIKELSIKRRETTITGCVDTETKVEELRQLSRFRAALEKYCKEVKVTAQRDTKEGLFFTLEVSGIPPLSKYLQEKAENEKAEKEAAKERAAEEQEASEKQPAEEQTADEKQGAEKKGAA